MNSTDCQFQVQHPVLRGGVKPVKFYCSVATAESVFLVGDFNDWNPTSLPMRRHVDGSWFLEVLLPHGHHQYVLLIDGNAVLDPNSMGTGLSDWNGRVSLVSVS